MRFLPILLLVALMIGCDPAPSTPIAPDQPAPDASKMTPEEMERMLKQNGTGSKPGR